MNPDAFFQPKLGQSLLFPGQSEVYRGQCVQSVGLYVQALGLKFPAFPSAYLYYQNGIAGFDKIPSGQPIKAGDIVVWGANFPPSGGNGHIDVAAADGSRNDFWAYDSNWQPPLKLAKIHHTGSQNNYIIGYLRKQGGNMGALEDRIKQLEASEQRLAQDVAARDKKIDSFYIKDTDNEYWRWDRLHSQIIGRHQPDRGVFRGAAVGRNWLNADEILSDHPEADTYYDDNHINEGDLTNLMAELGIPNPPNDNDKEFHINQHKASWKHAFYDLINRLDRVKTADLKAKVDELGKALDIKDKEIASLKAQVGDNSKWETLKVLLRELLGINK